MTTADGAEHFFRVANAEQIEGRNVFAWDERNLELVHELCNRHPEVVANGEKTLQIYAVALAKRPQQLALGHLGAGVQPLLELIEHDENLLPAAEHVPPADGLQGLGQIQGIRQIGAVSAQSLEQTRFRLVGRRFDVKANDLASQKRNHSGL